MIQEHLWAALEIYARAQGAALLCRTRGCAETLRITKTSDERGGAQTMDTEGASQIVEQSLRGGPLPQLLRKEISPSGSICTI